MNYLNKGNNKITKRLQSFPVALIVNTDKRIDPRKHWVVFYVSSRTKGEFSTVTDNDKRLQGYDSSVCGQYCVYYLMQRCRGMEMKSVVEPFTQNYANNDQFVYSLVNSAFPYCVNHSKE